MVKTWEKARICEVAFILNGELVFVNHTLHSKDEKILLLEEQVGGRRFPCISILFIEKKMFSGTTRLISSSSEAKGRWEAIVANIDQDDKVKFEGKDYTYKETTALLNEDGDVIPTLIFRRIAREQETLLLFQKRTVAEKIVVTVSLLEQARRRNPGGYYFCREY